MRLSVHKDDPGYVPTLLPAKVFLDGVELRGVSTADEERRLVEQAAFDEDGRYQLNEARTAVRSVVRHGHVRIEPMKASDG